MTQRPRRPTLRDIADETGLSTAAVSYALRGLQVTPQTQRRVRLAADQLGYQVDPIARALASGRTGYIGLLCGSLTDVWQQNLAAALGRGLLENGRRALIVDSSNDAAREAVLARGLLDQRVDGLIVLPVDPQAEHWAKAAQRTALVSIGDGLPGADTAAELVFDNRLGVTDALTRLARSGHHDIAVLTPGGMTTVDRPAEAMVSELGATLRISVRMRTCPHDLDGATAVALDLLTGAPRPTAVFCLADSLAYGVYAAARQLGLDVPGDVSILGYDDHPLSQLLTPGLSSYRWPVEAVVAAAVNETIGAIDGTGGGRTVYAPTPQMRGSVAVPNVNRPAP